MKWLYAIGLLACAFMPASAQTTSPEQVTTSVEISEAANTIAFRISWKDGPNVDSTMIAVFLSSDSLPILFRRGRSPDTVSFELPDDTTTYRFNLYSIRRGLVSLPADANFRFNADEYYRVVQLHIWPQEVTIRVGETVQLCAFFELNDGSILMRTQDEDKPSCLKRYSEFPPNVKRGRGARQRLVNKMCLEWGVVDQPSASPTSYYSPVSPEYDREHTAVMFIQKLCDGPTFQSTIGEFVAAGGWGINHRRNFEGNFFVVVRSNETQYALYEDRAQIFTLASMR